MAHIGQRLFLMLAFGMVAAPFAALAGAAVLTVLSAAVGSFDLFGVCVYVLPASFCWSLINIALPIGAAAMPLIGLLTTPLALPLWGARLVHASAGALLGCAAAATYPLTEGAFVLDLFGWVWSRLPTWIGAYLAPGIIAALVGNRFAANVGEFFGPDEP
jgi:hypothetical protein